MSEQAKPSVTVTKDGPYVVAGIEELVLSDGSTGEVKPKMFLCRCGMSKNKPFCDGSHSREGWTE